MIIEKRFKTRCVISKIEKFNQISVYWDDPNELDKIKDVLDSVDDKLADRLYYSEKTKRTYLKVKVAETVLADCHDFINMRTDLFLDVYSYIYEGRQGFNIKLFKVCKN